MTSRRPVSLLLPLALLASLFVASAANAWPHSPSANVLTMGGSNFPCVASDGAGGCFAGCLGYRDGVYGYDVFVQHYDSSGNPTWIAGGVDICVALDTQYPLEMVADGVGGCIVLMQDFRNNATSGSDIYLQRVSAAGALQWGATGVAVCTAAGAQDSPHMAFGPYGAWVVWNDQRNVATTNVDVYAQLVNLNGIGLGPANGAVVSTAAGSQSSPVVSVDDIGRGVFAWVDTRNSGVGDIYAQALNTNGAALLAANGVPVCVTAGWQTDPRVRGVANYGAVIAWSDSRGADSDIYAQQIDLNNAGAAVWTVNGVAECSGAGSQTLNDMTRDGNGNIVLVWNDTRAGSTSSDIYAQRLDYTGVPQWGSSGIPVHVGAPSYNARVISDQLGGTIFTWRDTRMDTGDIYAQRLGTNGNTMWTYTGVPVGTAESMQSSPTLCAGAPGSAIFGWSDSRSVGYGVRIQGVDMWGFLGAEPSMAGVKDIPNDQGGQVKVSWNASPLDYDPLFFNISDYIVYRSVPTRLAAQLSRAVPGEGGMVTLQGRRYLRAPLAAQDYYWEELAHVTPHHLSTYSYVAATEGDSVASSNPRTAFMVMALGYYNSYWWASKADSGYSVDNLAPVAPAPLTGQYAASGTALHWNPNTEPDLAGYRVYRGSSSTFVPSPATLLTTVADTGYVAGGSAPYFYKLSAIDTHGNESPVATLMPTGTLGVAGGVMRAEFSAPAPNPLHGDRGTSLRFALAVGGRTRLAIYDAQGRVVRTLVEGAREAGAQAVEFDGRDASGRALAPGLYLARISAPGLNATRRIVVVE